MTLNFKELEENIMSDIEKKRTELSFLYKTLDEVKEYGYTTTFGANDTEEGYKSAFESGRKIGEIEGQIDQLQTLFNFLYEKEITQEGEKNE